MRLLKFLYNAVSKLTRIFMFTVDWNRCLEIYYSFASCFSCSTLSNLFLIMKLIRIINVYEAILFWCSRLPSGVNLLYTFWCWATCYKIKVFTKRRSQSWFWTLSLYCIVTFSFHANIILGNSLFICSISLEYIPHSYLFIVILHNVLSLR